MTRVCYSTCIYPEPFVRWLPFFYGIKANCFILLVLLCGGCFLPFVTKDKLVLKTGIGLGC